MFVRSVLWESHGVHTRARRASHALADHRSSSIRIWVPTAPRVFGLWPGRCTGARISRARVGWRREKTARSDMDRHAISPDGSYVTHGAGGWLGCGRALALVHLGPAARKSRNSPFLCIVRNHAKSTCFGQRRALPCPCGTRLPSRWCVQHARAGQTPGGGAAACRWCRVSAVCREFSFLMLGW